jgi:hypothetical protein
MRSYLKKPFTKKGLVEWLKVQALNSAPVPKTKQNKTKQKNNFCT